MATQGLVLKFPVNRPLTEQEKGHRLLQGERMELSPYADLVVVKINSTYLEVVDKFFDQRGSLTGMVGSAVLGVFGFLVALFWDLEDSREDQLFFGFTFLVLAPVLICGAWVVLKECFSYTHYPIRLNRKTRMVHVFRINGTVLTVPWDDVFFTLGFQQEAAGKTWEIRGHILDADGETVRETFGLGVQSSGDAEGLLMLRSHWEFYRRYMEEGPQAVTKYVKYCMPVEHRREPFKSGYEVVLSQFERLKSNPITAIVWLALFPVLMLVVLGRWVAMRTSRIPRWPEDIEAANEVDADDPHIKDARINPPDLR